MVYVKVDCNVLLQWTRTSLSETFMELSGSGVEFKNYGVKKGIRP